MAMVHDEKVTILQLQGRLSESCAYTEAEIHD